MPSVLSILLLGLVFSPDMPTLWTDRMDSGFDTLIYQSSFSLPYTNGMTLLD